MTKLKWILLGLTGLLLIAVAPSRYLSSSAGIATTSLDYGVHLNISTHLRNLDVFPQFNNEESGKHSVSKYLPIYHGILGFHVITATLEYFGLPLPGAYNLVVDISFLACLLIFLFMVIDHQKLKRPFECLVVVVVAIPLFVLYFVEAMKAAFYSQLLSQALILVAFYIYRLNRQRIALLLLLYAGFCYPDLIIWFFPILFFSQHRIARITAYVLSPAWFVLMYVPFSRSNLAGPALVSQVVFYSTVALILLNIKPLWKYNRSMAIVLISFCIYSMALSLGTMTHFTPTYYASKISSFCYLALPVTILSTPVLSNFANRLLVAITLLLIFTSDRPWKASPLDYFSKPAFTNQDYTISLQAVHEIEIQTKELCRPDKTYLLPIPEQTSVASSATGGALANFNIYSLNLNSKGMDQLFHNTNGSLLSYLNLFSATASTRGPLALKQMIDKQALVTDFCLGVPTMYSALFADSQSFEKLFVGEHFVYFKPKKP